MSKPFRPSSCFQGPRRLMKKRASSSPGRHQRLRQNLPLPGASDMCKAHAYEYFPAPGYGIFTVFPFAPCATKLIFLSFTLTGKNAASLVHRCSRDTKELERTVPCRHRRSSLPSLFLPPLERGRGSLLGAAVGKLVSQSVSQSTNQSVVVTQRNASSSAVPLLSRLLHC